MRLFLCEKPSQARDIARVLGTTQDKGAGWIETPQGAVTWCFGHLLEQAMPDEYLPTDVPENPKGGKVWRLQDLPIIPQQWRVRVRKDVAAQYKVIQGLLRNASEVIIATDADREGEMIAREVLELAGYRGPLKRLWLSALDEESIKKGLAQLRHGASTESLYWAALARSRADWLVGMNLTRAFTLRGRAQGQAGVLSVGRVQTPTLALVVARDREIESFKPTPYYDVRADIRVGQGHFVAAWRVPEDIADDNGRCLREDVAQAVKQRVEGQMGVITQAETQRRKEAPPLVYDLASLQMECSARYNMGAQKVLDIAQSLYETHKITTYPRTDCGYLPESQHQEAPIVLQAIAGGHPELASWVKRADISRKSPAWNDKKITAHHGIIPTRVAPRWDALSEDEKRVYDLISRRYLAQFFPDHEYDQTKIEASFDKDVFTASGRVIRVDGWKALYKSHAEDNEDQAQDNEQALPPMQKGEAAQALRVWVERKMTRPPSRYTEGTLLQAMKNIGRNVSDPRLKAILKETAGIGTEATRAGIIQTLLEREYIVKKRKELISTDKGRQLIDALPDYVRSPEMTALWEQALEEIAEGKRKIDTFLQDQAAFVAEIVKQVKEELSTAGTPHAESASQRADCPSCGKKNSAVRLYSPKRQRHFWKCEACNTFFDDKDGRLDQEGYQKKQQQAQQSPVCPACQQGRLLRREGKYGPFWGCSAYPKCKAIFKDAHGQPDFESARKVEDNTTQERRRSKSKR